MIMGGDVSGMTTESARAEGDAFGKVDSRFANREGVMTVIAGFPVPTERGGEFLTGHGRCTLRHHNWEIGCVPLRLHDNGGR